MNKILLLILASLCLALSGCQKGPDRDALNREIQNKLDTRFQDGLFKVIHLERSGSYPFAQKDDSTPRLLVYFRAKVQFLRDYNLSQWDKLNATTLASVLGATPIGIKGISKDGNKKNDEFSVFGTSRYEKRNEEWVSTFHIGASEDKGKTKPGFDEETLVDRLILDLSRKNTELKKRGDIRQLNILEQELDHATFKINLKLDRMDSTLTLASGIRSGEYFSIGRGLEEAFQAKKINFRTYSSAGSIANCRYVNEEMTTFGISQNDIAWMALKGEKLFEDMEPMTNLQAVCSLYPEAVQIIVLDKSLVQNFDDLRGKVVNVGPSQSGMRVNAKQIIHAHGFSEKDFSRLTGHDLGNGLRELVGGKVDAVLATMAWPGRLIEDIASSHPIRLVSLEEKIIVALLKDRPSFVPITIPKNTYLGMNNDVKTVGVTAMVITHKNTPGAQVRQFLEMLYSNDEFLSKESHRAHYISTRTAHVGIPIPMHQEARIFLGL